MDPLSHKSPKIAALIAEFQGGDLSPHYLGYFKCFNQQLFYEAHDVLEELWLPSRKGPHDLYYKGLIQLAGAFVHLQKARLKPAFALFDLAKNNLSRYSSPHERLDLAKVLDLIGSWQEALRAGDFLVNPLSVRPAPRLELEAKA